MHPEINTWTGEESEPDLSARPRSANRFYQAVLKPKAIIPACYMTVEDPAAMIEMVAAGFGISLAPMWSVRSLTESGRLKAVSVTRKRLFTTWHATFLKSNSTPVFLKAFIRQVRAAGILPGDRGGAAS